MKITLKSLLILMLAGFPTILALGQQGILSASGEATGTGGTVSWSAGQVAYSAWINTSGSVNEGVQQPYEIYFARGIQEAGTAPECTVYPNPTTGKVTLKFTDPPVKNFQYSIYNIEGIRLFTAVVDAKEVAVKMDNLQPATYFLVLHKNDLPVRTYKIIKK